MNRKVFVIIAALLVFGVTNVFAFGIGLQLNGNVQKKMNFGPAITFKTDSIPLIFALSYDFSNDPAIGLTGDYWAINKSIIPIGSSSLNWFFGIGFYVQTIFADNFVLDAGLRVPIGLNMFVIDGFLEPFVMVAPSFGVVFLPKLATSNVFFPISAGFRLWFK